MNKSIIQGIVVSGLLYGFLFAFHIWLAIKGYMGVFRVIAWIITIHTLAVGPSIILLGKVKELDGRVLANRIGVWISLPLCVGLGWAYAGMAYDFTWIIWFMAIAILVHYLVGLKLHVSESVTQVE